MKKLLLIIVTIILSVSSCDFSEALGTKKKEPAPEPAPEPEPAPKITSIQIFSGNVSLPGQSTTNDPITKLVAVTEPATKVIFYNTNEKLGESISGIDSQAILNIDFKEEKTYNIRAKTVKGSSESDFSAYKFVTYKKRQTSSSINSPKNILLYDSNGQVYTTAQSKVPIGRITAEAPKDSYIKFYNEDLYLGSSAKVNDSGVGELRIKLTEPKTYKIRAKTVIGSDSSDFSDFRTIQIIQELKSSFKDFAKSIGIFKYVYDVRIETRNNKAEWDAFKNKNQIVKYYRHQSYLTSSPTRFTSTHIVLSSIYSDMKTNPGSYYISGRLNFMKKYKELEDMKANIPQIPNPRYSYGGEQEYDGLIISSIRVPPLGIISSTEINKQEKDYFLPWNGKYESGDGNNGPPYFILEFPFKREISSHRKITPIKALLIEIRLQLDSRTKVVKISNPKKYPMQIGNGAILVDLLPPDIKDYAPSKNPSGELFKIEIEAQDGSTKEHVFKIKP